MLVLRYMRRYRLASLCMQCAGLEMSHCICIMRCKCSPQPATIEAGEQTGDAPEYRPVFSYSRSDWQILDANNLSAAPKSCPALRTLSVVGIDKLTRNHARLE